MIKKDTIKFVSAALIAISAASVQAADVEGDVETNVTAGEIKQKVKGFGNTNNIEIGNVKGRNTDVNGTVTTNVNVDSVDQKAKGFANTNQIKVGNVE